MKVSNFLCVAAAVSLSHAAFGANPPKNRISESKAQSIALREAPGTIASSELEFERKQWVYSFDIRGADQQIHEVLVNAQSGKVIESTIESPAKEAKEASSEAGG
jgi:uncharacterized membrane protein YkoI